MRKAEPASVELVAVQPRHFVIIGAEKYQSRTLNRVPQSKWDVVLRDAVSGEVVHDIVSAQSVTSPDLKRDGRYEERHGSTSVVKDLENQSEGREGLPELVVKSFHHDVWRGDTHFKVRLEDLHKSAHYLRVQGFCCYVGEHEQLSRRTPGGKKKPFVIMQKIGDGRDLFTLAQDREVKAVICNSTEALQKLLGAFCRLMALLEYFYAQEGRPVLDLKSENIMPIRDEHGHIIRFVLIDLDNSFGTETMFTPDAMPLGDYIRVARHWNKSKELGTAIDFHSLASMLAETINALSSGACFSMRNTQHPVSLRHRLMVIEPKTSALDSLPVKLYQALMGAVDGMPAREMISAAFSETTGADYYLQQFDDEAASLQRRVEAVRHAMAAPARAVEFPAPPAGSDRVGRPKGAASPALFQTADELALLALDGSPSVPYAFYADKEESCVSRCCESIRKVFRC
ncbi:MAG: hypothetical protein P1U34_05305 [Coxiellaceae bacterium]|nr:hypothetical protein [Coxiellaceae bacterium]